MLWVYCAGFVGLVSGFPWGIWVWFLLGFLWVDCLLALGLRVLGGLRLFWVSLVAGCVSECCGVGLVAWFVGLMYFGLFVFELTDRLVGSVCFCGFVDMLLIVLVSGVLMPFM